MVVQRGRHLRVPLYGTILRAARAGQGLSPRGSPRTVRRRTIPGHAFGTARSFAGSPGPAVADVGAKAARAAVGAAPGDVAGGKSGPRNPRLATLLKAVNR